jgi:hypothetical protein
MGGLTRAWRKTGHTGRDGGVPTVRPANGPESDQDHVSG